MRNFSIQSVIAFFAGALLLASCAGVGAGDAIVAEQVDVDQRLNDYELGPSDRIRLIVFNEPDLSGEFSINARGQISMPLLGEVDAEGLSIEELRLKVAEGLAEGFVKDAQVAAEVIDFRPYYILGEVNAPGEYPYSSGISVIKAVAAAGGFTYRANKSVVYVKRAESDDEVKYKLSQQLMVFPGDVVRVGERFF